MSHDVPLYVLTRTANRPKMFARLRESLISQDYAGRVVHVVHAETGSDYAEGDVLVTGPPQPRALGTAPWEMHNQRLLETVARLTRGTTAEDTTHPPGWVCFIDDDDVLVDGHAASRMVSFCTNPGIMPIWRVEREKGRLSPGVWQGDLASRDGRICWEGAAHHTSHIGKATIDANDGADGRYWATLARYLKPIWVNEVLTRPQAGKGKGRRRDYV